MQVRDVFFNRFMEHNYLKPLGPSPFPLRERFMKCFSGSLWEITLQQKLVRISMLEQP